MRDRLTELILNAPREDVVYGDIKLNKPVQTAQSVADHLLANGVIVLPCKVGDTVWYELYGKIESAVVYSCVGVFKKQGVEITDANAKSSDGLEVTFTGECIGKTVFLTKEEAERVLKEREQDGC